MFWVFLKTGMRLLFRLAASTKQSRSVHMIPVSNMKRYLLSVCVCSAVCARCPWPRGRVCSRRWTSCTRSWSNWVPWSRAASVWTVRHTMQQEMSAVNVWLIYLLFEFWVFLSLAAIFRSPAVWRMRKKRLVFSVLTTYFLHLTHCFLDLVWHIYAGRRVIRSISL